MDAQYQEIMTRYQGIYTKVVADMTGDEEEDEILLNDTLDEYNLPETFFADFTELNEALTVSNEEEVTRITDMYVQHYHETNSSGVQETEGSTAEVSGTLEETEVTPEELPQVTEEVVQNILNKSDIDNISYDVVLTLYREYAKTASIPEQLVGLEVQSIIEGTGAQNKALLAKVKINTDLMEMQPDLKEFLQIKTEETPNRGRGSGISEEDTRRDSMMFLQVLVKVYTMLTWQRVEYMISLGRTSITEEHLAILPVDADPTYVTDYARKVKNRGSQDNYMTKISICRKFIQDNTEDFRIARKIEEEDQAKQVRKERESTAQTAFETKYKTPALDAEINNIINVIQAKYIKILTPIFINKPEGVLTTEGLLYFDASQGQLKVREVSNHHARRLFETISEGWMYKGQPSLHLQESNLYSFDYELDIFDDNMQLTTTYIPTFLLMAVEGLYWTPDKKLARHTNLGSYRQELIGMITVYIQQICYKLIEKVEQKGTDKEPIEIVSEAKSAILTLFLNTVYCNTLDLNTSIALTFSVNYSYFNGNNTLSDVMADLDNAMGTKLHIPKGDGKLISGKTNDSIGRFLYATNWDNYVGDTLFSYEAIEKQQKAGYKQSLSNIVIGRRIDGSDVKLDLAVNTNVFTTIMAGSRSGKGVQTLNILLTALGVGTDIAYMDSKPDMAGIFWDLERKYKVPILAVDAKANSTASGQAPIRSHEVGVGFPKSLMNKGIDLDELKVMGYLKMVILMSTISTVLYTGSNKDAKDAIKMYAEGEAPSSNTLFVFDEINDVSRRAGAILGHVEGIMSKLPKGTKASEADLANTDYLTKMRTFLKESLMLSLSSMADTTGAVSGVKSIYIGQDVSKSAWYYGGGLVTTQNPFYYVIKKANTSILGVRHGSDKDYGISLQSPPSNKEGIEFLGLSKSDGGRAKNDEDPTQDPALGYFALLSGGAVSKNGYIYKSYLTLNANDIEKVYPSMRPYLVKDDIKDVMGSYTGGLLGRSANPDRVYQKDLIKEVNGEVQPNYLIGFLPLMEKVLQDSNPNQAIAEKSFKKTLTTLYCCAYNLIRYAGYEYKNLEDFLYDCSGDTLLTPHSIKQREGHRLKYGAEAAKNIPYEPLTQEEVRQIVYGEKDYRLPTYGQEASDDSDASVYTLEERQQEQPQQVFEQEEESQQEDNTQPPVNLDDMFNSNNIPEQQGYGDDEQNEENRYTEEEEPQPWDEPTQETPYPEEEEQPRVEQPQPRREKETENRSTPPVEPFVSQQTNQWVENEPQQGESVYDNVPETFHNEDVQQYGNEQGVAISNTVEIDMNKRSNPFTMLKDTNNPMSVAKALAQSSVILMQEVKKVVGDLSRVQYFIVSPTGITVNDVKIQLKFTSELLEKYPRDIALRLSRGNYTDLLYFPDLYKMKNMVDLTIDVPLPAEHQVLQDLGVQRNPKSIVNKLRKLVVFKLNGSDLLAIEQVDTERPSKLRGSLANFFGIGRQVSDTVMPALPTQRIMQSNTIRGIGKGTLQAGAVWGLFNVAIPVFGFFGLLAGAFAVGNIMVNKKQRDN